MKLPSSWIASIRYLSTPDGAHYLIIFAKSGEALLWKGTPSSIPSYLPGLIQAGTGGRSVGHALHVLRKQAGVLEGCGYQRITDKKEVQQLKEMVR